MFWMRNKENNFPKHTLINTTTIVSFRQSLLILFNYCTFYGKFDFRTVCGYVTWVFFSCGYDGFHKKRTEEFYDEGEATFYKTARFGLVDVSTYRVADLVEKVGLHI